MKKAFLTGLLLPVFAVSLLSAQTVKKTHHSAVRKIKVQYGTASFYANKFNGRKTYTGEIFSQQKMTAASNTLPMGTWVRITNSRNNKTAIVRVNDKMHPKNRRLIDLSHAAARKLGFTGHGLAKVKVDVLGKKKPEEVVAEETAKAKTH